MACPAGAGSVVAALVDSDLRELTWPVTHDVEVVPISLASGDGMRIYRRSLCFLLIVAAQELFPRARIVIDHSLTLGGFFCWASSKEPLGHGELARVERRMRQIAAVDEPISRRDLPVAQVIELFRRQQCQHKVRLLRYCHKASVPIYTLRGIDDYFYGYMVPSTRYLRHFALHPYPPGFILRFPPRYAPSGLSPFQDFSRLAAVFREYGRWVEAMGVEYVDGLNRAAEADHIQQVVLVAEALQEQAIADIAREIASRRDRPRLVLIAGPSSSGKTAFAKRLAIQLATRRVRPLVLSLDDYSLNRKETPLDAYGDYDYEGLDALDLDLLNHQLRELLAGREVALPHYDFVTGQRECGPTLTIGPRHIILAEGLHGLNPDLLSSLHQEGGIPEEHVFRIYVSALTQLNLDCHNRIATTDTRLLRRIVRDARERGTSALESIRRWEKVVQGEFHNIFPYQQSADIMFNSALVYELTVMKPLAEPLLRQIDPGGMEYVEARRLLSFLEWFLPCGPDLIPDNSILREFVGGSNLEGFAPTCDVSSAARHSRRTSRPVLGLARGGMNAAGCRTDKPETTAQKQPEIGFSSKGAGGAKGGLGRTIPAPH